MAGQDFQMTARSTLTRMGIQPGLQGEDRYRRLEMMLSELLEDHHVSNSYIARLGEKWQEPPPAVDDEVPDRA